MSGKSIETLDVENRRAWRKWLKEHHDSVTEIWLVFYKRHTGRVTVTYDEAVEEAICYGWIDSLVRRLDGERYAQKFTPRKPNSRWSTANRRRYADLEARGRLTGPGRRRPPTDRDGDAPAPKTPEVPSYIVKALRKNARAWKYFETLAPSYRRAYVGWIDSAKRADTKERRLREAVRTLAAGKKLGLK